MARARQYPPSVDPGIPIEPTPPAGWNRVRFGDVLDVVERPAQLNDEQEYQLVNAKRSRGGIVARDRLRGREILVKNQFEIQPNDFLISKRQVIHGACGVVPPQLAGAVVSNEYAVLRPKPPLTVEFLKHLSHTAYFQRTCFHSSVGVDVEKMVFKLEQWFQFSLPVPPEREQRQINTILSSVDKAIETSTAVINQLEIVKKALMQELLTRGLPGHHTRFKQTEIGEIPDGWELLTLGSLAKIERGKFSHRPRNDPRFYGGQYPFVQTGDVAASRGRITRYSQTLNEEGLKVSKLFPTGTIIITIAANIGDTAIAEFEVAFPDSLVGIQPGPLVDTRFLELVLRTRKQSLEESAPQNAQKNINLQILEPLLIQIPPLDEQRSIADALELIGARLEAEIVARDEQRALKASLLSALLSGEVRVPLEQEAA